MQSDSTGKGRWKIRLVKGAKTLAFLVIALFLVLTLANNFRELKSFPFKWDWLSATAVLVCITTVFTIQAFLWNLILRSLGTKLPFRSTTYTYFLSLFGKYVPGKIWVPAIKIMHLEKNRANGTAQRAVIVSVIIEQVYHIGSGILFGCLIIDFNALIGIPNSIFIGGAVLLSLAIILAPGLALNFAMRVKKNPEPNTKEIPRINAGKAAGLFAAYFILWIVFGAIVSLFASILFPLESSFDLRIGGAYALGVIAGFLALFAPAGIGVRESAFIILAQPVLSAPVALVFGFALRILLSFAELLGVGFFYLIRPRSQDLSLEQVRSRNRGEK